MSEMTGEHSKAFDVASKLSSEHLAQLNDLTRRAFAEGWSAEQHRQEVLALTVTWRDELFDRFERALREAADAARGLRALGVTPKESESRLGPVLEELEGAFDDA